MVPEIARIYGNRVRIRVCGLCWNGDKLLIVNHKGLNTSDFWAPPGGGLDFGEQAADAIRREFLEETNLRVQPGPFRFLCEFIQPPLHAIELFFHVDVVGGRLAPGNDPELPLLAGAAFVPVAEICAKPAETIHGIFRYASTAQELRNLQGFYRI